MRLTFTAKIKETRECRGIWLNTILVRKKDGNIVTLDRDMTNYYISADGHSIQVEFRNVYAWDSETSTADYHLDHKDFEGAKLYHYEVEDDADDDYELVIDTDSLHFC